MYAHAYLAMHRTEWNRRQVLPPSFSLHIPFLWFAIEISYSKIHFTLDLHHISLDMNFLNLRSHDTPPPCSDIREQYSKNNANLWVKYPSFRAFVEKHKLFRDKPTKGFFQGINSHSSTCAINERLQLAQLVCDFVLFHQRRPSCSFEAWYTLLWQMHSHRTRSGRN